MSLWLDSKYEFMDSLKRGKSEEEQNMSYEPNKEFWVWVVGEIEFWNMSRVWDMSFERWILSNHLAPIQTSSNALIAQRPQINQPR